MEVIIESTQEAASLLAAKMIAALVHSKPTAVLGLATGSTPLGLYRELARMHRDEGLDFSQVTSFNLDEYVGLGPSHPASYHHFMRENFFQHINLPAQNTHIPDGLSTDIPQTCEEYESTCRFWALAATATSDSTNRLHPLLPEHASKLSPHAPAPTTHPSSAPGRRSRST